MAGAIYVVGAAGTVALVLSATGLYAVLSYIVALRRREIGVRLAIGAPPSRIVTLVVRQALKLVLAGMACGLALAVPMAFAMRATFVAKVTAADPMVFLPTIAVLLTVRHRGGRGPRPAGVSDRSDRYTAAGIAQP